MSRKQSDYFKYLQELKRLRNEEAINLAQIKSKETLQLAKIKVRFLSVVMLLDFLIFVYDASRNICKTIPLQ